MEATQVKLEVDVEPFAARRFGFADGDCNKLGVNATTPVLARNDGVQDECVARSIPRHVHKAYEQPVTSRVQRSDVCRTWGQ